MNDTIYDLIVVGSGAAGASAAIYATRFNLKTLMLGGDMPGGLITEALDVENYPGYLSISGMKLSKNFTDQAVNLGAEYIFDIVTEINVNNQAKIGKQNVKDEKDKEGNLNNNYKRNKDRLFEVKTYSNTYLARSVILALGTKHRKLGVPGEEEFAGKGVSYCSTCDAPFFKGKTVAVIGGGNTSVEGAQDVGLHAKKVYFLYKYGLTASPVYIEQLRSKTNIVEVPDNGIATINGKEHVTSITLENPFNGLKELPVDGVFIQIGYSPRNELAKQLRIELTDYGYVRVDNGMGTNIKGVFCAGDLNNASNMLHQQITSAAEGAIAAQSAYRYLQGLDHIIPS